MVDYGERQHKITISIRLTPDEFKELKARCESCEPPTNPTVAIRWLIRMWIEEEHAGKP